MTKFSSPHGVFLFTAVLLASISSIAADVKSSNMAKLGPFLLTSPARNMTLEYNLGLDPVEQCKSTNVLH
jgi:hypothetical protein